MHGPQPDAPFLSSIGPDEDQGGDEVGSTLDHLFLVQVDRDILWLTFSPKPIDIHDG